jgi:aldose 1-epimerase
MTGLTLHSGALEADIVPSIGGGLAAFRWHGQDIMRPASAEALAAGDPLGLAMFPLVPWSNRIALGRFQQDGQDVTLPRNLGDHPHAIHGHGWQQPWSVAASSESSAVLTYDHSADAWPWAYHAQLHYRLTVRGLESRLSVENRSATRMPAGLGLHPYFQRTPQMQVHARLDGWWETDAEVMPTQHRTCDERTDWSGLLREGRTIDTAFTGWDGSAKLVWPEAGLELQMTASNAARWLVIYAPQSGSIICLEPVTHPTNAFNQSERPGIRLLDPGESTELTLRLEPGGC